MNRGKPWSEGDVFDLRNSLNHGDRAKEVADFLCWDVWGVEDKMAELKLAERPENRGIGRRASRKFTRLGRALRGVSSSPGHSPDFDLYPRDAPPRAISRALALRPSSPSRQACAKITSRRPKSWVGIGQDKARHSRRAASGSRRISSPSNRRVRTTTISTDKTEPLGSPLASLALRAGRPG